MTSTYKYCTINYYLNLTNWWIATSKIYSIQLRTNSRLYVGELMHSIHILYWPLDSVMLSSVDIFIANFWPTHCKGCLTFKGHHTGACSGLQEADSIGERYKWGMYSLSSTRISNNDCALLQSLNWYVWIILTPSSATKVQWTKAEIALWSVYGIINIQYSSVIFLAHLTNINVVFLWKLHKSIAVQTKAHSNLKWSKMCQRVQLCDLP